MSSDNTRAGLNLAQIRDTIDKRWKDDDKLRNRWSEYLMRYKNEMYDESYLAENPNVSDVSANYFFANISQLAPLLTDNRPEWSVRARSHVEQPYMNLWGEALKWLWDVMQMKPKVLKLVMDALVMDQGIAHVSWTPDDQDGKGMVSVRVVDPRTFVFAKGYDNLEDCPWMAEKTKQPISWIRTNYPKTGKKVVADTADEGYSAGDMSVWDEHETEVTVYSMWMRDPTTEEVIREENNKRDPSMQDKDVKSLPKKKYPNGRFVVFVNQAEERGGPILLEDNPSPYRHGHSPYVFLYDYIVPHEIWGQGEMPQVYSLVNELNKKLQSAASQLQVFASPNFICAPQVDVKNVRETFHAGGNFYEVKGQWDADKMAPIAPIETPGPKRELFIHIDQVKHFIEEISGMTEVTKGVIDKKAEQTASEINTIAETSHTRTRQRVRNLEQAITVILHRVLSIAMQFIQDRQYSTVRDGRIGFQRISTGKEFAMQALRDWHESLTAPGEGFDPEDEEMAQEQGRREEEQQQKAAIDLEVFQNLFPVDGDPVLSSFDIEVQSDSMLPTDFQSRANLMVRLLGMSAVDAQAVLTTLQIPNAEEIVERMKADEAAKNAPPAAPPPPGAPGQPLTQPQPGV